MVTALLCQTLSLLPDGLLLDTSEEVLPHKLEGTNYRSWEVEYDTNIQTTKVKGRLKNNVAYWQDSLQAPAPVLDWIQNGYKLPLFSEPPRSVKKISNRH